MVGPLIFRKRHLSKSLAQVLPRKGRLGGTFLVEAGGATLEFLKCEGKSRKCVLFYLIFFSGDMLPSLKLTYSLKMALPKKESRVANPWLHSGKLTWQWNMD